MKKTFKHLLLSAILVLMFGLFGCGTTLTTNLNISDNFAGTRNMDVYISQSDFSDNVEGDFVTIATQTEAVLPECLQFTYDVDEYGDYNFHFVLDFTSHEDYMTKVESLIGEGYSSDYSYSTAPFSEGVALEEDFDSEDLLQWFKDFLVDYGYVDSSDASYIFEYTDNIVTFNGIEYDSYSNDISINEQSYIKINKINFFTDIDADNAKIARKIEVVFDSYTKDSYSEKIETYLTGITPEGCASEWQSTDDGYEKYVILIPASTPDELTALMQTFTSSEKSSVQLVIAGETIGAGTGEEAETEETEDSVSKIDEWENEVLGDLKTETVDSSIYKQPFGFDSVIVETLDLDVFACDSWGEVYTRYYISAKNGQPSSEIHYGEDEYTYYGNDYIDDTYPEYYYISGMYDTEYQLTSTVNKYFVPTSTKLTTTVKSADKIKREFVFKFDEPFEDVVAEKIETKLEKLFEGKEDVLSIDISNKKKNTTITWTFEGSVAEVNAVCSEIFGAGYSELSYTCQEGFKLKQQYSYKESVDMGYLFNWNYGGDVEYSIKLPGKIVKESSYVSGSSNVEYSGKNASVLLTDTAYVYATFEGARTNSIVIILILVIVFVVIAGVAVVVIVLIKNAKKKPNLQGQMPYGQPMNPQMAQPMNPQMAQPMNPQMAQPMNPQMAQPVGQPVEQPVNPQEIPEQQAAEEEVNVPKMQATTGSFCANCGAMLSEGSVFCGNCGNKVQ